MFVELRGCGIKHEITAAKNQANALHLNLNIKNLETFGELNK